MSDPEPRVWYEHISTGDRGYLLRGADGRDMIRYDRPNDPAGGERVFQAGEWRPVLDVRPISGAAAARICFEADRAMCLALGMHAMAKRDWLGLSEKTRVEWIENGPADPSRRALYLAIRGVLEPKA